MRTIIYSAISVVLLSGCSLKVGPRELKSDSVYYNHAVQDSIEKQLLLNIVRLRYRDTPTFLDVNVIASSYEFKRSGGVNWKLDPGDKTSWGASLGADFTEKPTVTYQPLKSEGLVKQFLTPITIDTLLLLNSSGWRIDRLLRCCVQRMNDLQNAPTASGPTPHHPPEYRDFKRLARLFRELEKKDAVNILTERDANGKDMHAVLTFSQTRADPMIMEEIWDLLGLDKSYCSIRLIPYHCKRNAGNEVLIDTRSPLSVLYFLSQGVHVPFADEFDGKVTVTLDDCGNRFDWDDVMDGLLEVNYQQGNHCASSCEAVSVCYRGSKFYISDSDITSKSTFSLLTQLLALQTGNPIIPMYTIPLN